MMVFTNAEELYKVFGLTIDKVMKDKAFVDKLAATNMVVGLKVPNLDAFITLECKGSLKVSYGPPSVSVDVTAVNDDVTFNKFWQGKVNLMVAMAKGQIKAQGAVTKMLKVLPIISPIYKMYVSSLKEAGREDLLV